MPNAPSSPNSDPAPTHARPCWGLHHLLHLSPNTNLKPGSAVVPSLQIRELRPREAAGLWAAAQLTAAGLGLRPSLPGVPGSPPMASQPVLITEREAAQWLQCVNTPSLGGFISIGVPASVQHPGPAASNLGAEEAD